MRSPRLPSRIATNVPSSALLPPALLPPALFPSALFLPAAFCLLCLLPSAAEAQMVTPGDPGAAPIAAPPAREPGETDAKMRFEAGSPLGLWRTIDDRTGKSRSLVRIVDRGDGVLVGRIERILEPLTSDPVCEKCEDDRRNQPIEGLEIIRGLKPDDGCWSGGRILNPEDGKIYHLKATPIDGGQKLEMRGYIGMPLFGRTQVWIREP